MILQDLLIFGAVQHADKDTSAIKERDANTIEFTTISWGKQIKTNCDPMFSLAQDCHCSYYICKQQCNTCNITFSAILA